MSPLLNTAKNVKRGSAQVQRVYRGTALVWQYAINTTTSLTVDNGNINAGQTANLTATVSDPNAVGTVNFRRDSPTGTIVGTDTAKPWTCAVSPTTSTLYYAEYLGSAPHQPSKSGAVSVIVAGSTAVSLTASATTVELGDSVTLTAAVNNGAVTTGTMNFRSGSITGTIVDTVTAAPYVTTVTPQGDTTYFAEYLGIPQAQAANSSGLTIDSVITTATTLSVSPTTVNAGGSVTLTADVSKGTAGTVNFYTSAGTLIAAVPAAPWTATHTPTDDTSYYAVYQGSGDMLPSTSNTVSVNYQIPTSISLTVSPTSINKGQSVTLTATVTGATAGTVQFRTGSATGTIIGTDTASPWTMTHAPTADTTYYATYVANGNYLGSSSSGKAVNVKQLVTKTWSSDGTWSASYDGGGAKRSTSDLYYGYYSSTWGNQKSLIGWSNLPDFTASNVEAISSMRLKFYNEHHYLNSGGDIPIGTHDYATEPSTASTSRIDENLQTYGSAPLGGWVDVTLNSSFRSRFLSGSDVGIALGPGPSTSTNYYGYASDVASSNEPWLEIKYTVWE